MGVETTLVIKMDGKINAKKGMRILLRTNTNETIGMAQIISLVPYQYK